MNDDKQQKKVKFDDSTPVGELPQLYYEMRGDELNKIIEEARIIEYKRKLKEEEAEPLSEDTLGDISYDK